VVRGLLIFATATAAAGCVDRPDTYIVPLAEFDAEVQLGRDDRIFASSYMLRMIADTEPCLVLSPRDTRINVDGVPGELDTGHPEHDNRPCYGPAMMFDSFPSSSGPSTFEITDGSATWTFVIWQPFDYPDLTLLSPTPATPGDTITVHFDSPQGTMTDVSASARDADYNDLFDLDLDTGVTIVDRDVSFVLPDLPPGLTTIQLEVRAEYDVRIDRCDAPRGCRPAAGQPSFLRMDLAIAPPP
jgi:hypothetical protein